MQDWCVFGEREKIKRVDVVLCGFLWVVAEEFKVSGLKFKVGEGRHKGRDIFRSE